MLARYAAALEPVPAAQRARDPRPVLARVHAHAASVDALAERVRLVPTAEPARAHRRNTLRQPDIMMGGPLDELFSISMC